MENVAILGSTGSIGTQTLDVIDRFPNLFKVSILSARRASKQLLEQAKKYRPEYVITEEPAEEGWKKELPIETKHLTGLLGLSLALERVKPKKVVNAISGIFGIEPSFRVLEHTDALLLLANKETVLAAGEFLKPFLKRIIPLDSEHNALFQLLQNLKPNEVKRIFLTASGGPFRGKTKEDLKSITPKEALKHPRWNMGKKITVDSATLMNKGFEVIEAHYLFNIPFEKVEVLIHPQSVVHGIVETIDGNLFMLASPTDMRFPIHHALFWPLRVKTSLEGLDLTKIQKLEFEKPDFETFECLKIAYELGKKGLPYTALLVGADEGAVELFLEGKIQFLEIPQVIKATVETLAAKYQKVEFEKIPSIVMEAYKYAKSSVDNKPPQG